MSQESLAGKPVRESPFSSTLQKTREYIRESEESIAELNKILGPILKEEPLEPDPPIEEKTGQPELLRELKDILESTIRNHRLLGHLIKRVGL